MSYVAYNLAALVHLSNGASLVVAVIFIPILEGVATLLMVSLSMKVMSAMSPLLISFE